MDKQMSGIIALIIFCVFLILLRYTVFSDIGKTEELIPGVTDSREFTLISSNSSLYNYTISEEFMKEVTGVKIHSNSMIYGSNTSQAKNIYERSKNSLIGQGFEEDYTTEYPKKGKYTGVFVNDTRKRSFYIFEGSRIEDATNFYLILAVYEVYR